MRKHSFFALVTITAIICCVRTSRADLLFSHGTDTIAIAGNTPQSTACTYETVVELNSTSYTGGWGSGGNVYVGSGLIFNTWQDNLEDEVLTVLNGGAALGGAYPLTWPQGVHGPTNLQTGQWYDLAYVYDGSQERIYVDGMLAGSVSASGGISSGSGAIGTVGALEGDGFLNPSFLGEIQSLRISNTARYSGSSYSATLGDFSDDASTQLLYDFDTAPVGGKIQDLSGNGHTGTLGAGFSGATSPTFITVPEPSSMMLIGFVLGMCAQRRRADKNRIIPALGCSKIMPMTRSERFFR
jgi:hypothetical protein